MGDKIKILVVEDDPNIAKYLVMELEHEGFAAEKESNGKRAFERILQGKYQLILLDLMLPEMDGLEICRKVREFSDVPIIMLTAKVEIEDRVTGLDIGADDYVTKPFAMPEVLARVRTALRHTMPPEEPQGEVLVTKDFVLYQDRYQVKVQDTLVDLTKMEYDLQRRLLHWHHSADELCDRDHHILHALPSGGEGT